MKIAIVPIKVTPIVALIFSSRESSVKKYMVAATAVVALGVVSSAYAADMPVKAPAYKAPAYAPLYNWSGCYLGADVGGTWNRVAVNVPAYPFPDHTTTTSSVSGGALAGCNYMFSNRVVLGIEGDYSWMNLNATALSGNGGTELFTTQYNASASARGRLGYSPEAMPNSLWYVTGGWAWARLNNSFYTPLAGGTNSGSATGWVVGGGVEWALTPAWIVGLEYLHSQYGTENQVFLGPNTLKLTEDTVRARLSYKFNLWGTSN
jgi:outer membrane immunogenic protein